MRLAQHAGAYWHLYMQAAAAEPEIAEEWRLLTARRRETCSSVAATIPPIELREELDVAMIADTIWTIASPETYLMLTHHGGYDDIQTTAWLARTLTNALCIPGD